MVKCPVCYSELVTNYMGNEYECLDCGVEFDSDEEDE
jgi:hypothetical protein